MSELRPLPPRHPDSEAFWDFCRRRELRIQRCSACGTWRHYPRPVCDRCHARAFEWAPVSGRGRVYTWTVAHHAFHPGFAGDLPYAVVTVELEEGPRMISQVVDVAPEDLRIDMPVEIVFEDVAPEVTLPKFRRARTPVEIV